MNIWGLMLPVLAVNLRCYNFEFYSDVVNMFRLALIFIYCEFLECEFLYMFNALPTETHRGRTLKVVVLSNLRSCVLSM